jgi:Kef-type K+ transport system membrane component KefB
MLARTSPRGFTSTVTSFEPAALFFLQAAVILGACRLLTWAGRRALQPAVVCEMLAGILLGPSFFGALLPAAHARLFPASSMAALQLASQVGIVLYMFTVGLDFRLDLLAKGWRASAAVSSSGIAAPLALGAALGAALWSAGGSFGPGVGRGTAMIFTGAALSITAFPVLARIVLERGLSGTPLGTLVLGAGAFDDAGAWLLLAAILAGLDARPWSAALPFIGGAAYAALLARVVRPAARRLVESRPRDALGPGALPVVLIALASAAWFTNAIGLHGVFGAFLLGAALPRGTFAESLRAKIAPAASTLLVPLFFAYSGLNTRLGLLAGPREWLALGAVVLAATGGKGVACALAARAGGMPAAEAAAVGALMNARGLMELILLAIGLERGILTPTLFTMLAVMAVATTMAASPVFELLRPRLSAGSRARAPSPSRAS